ncbi:MAG: phosphate ABC transporter substrate-binding protein [Coriobacteriia bacterium]
MTHRLTGPITSSSSFRRARVLRVALAVCILLVAPAITACDSRENDEQIIVTGSTTLLPIAEIAGEDYAAENPGIKVLVSGLGSAAGIESVAAGSSDIGTSSRDLKETENDLGLYDTVVAMDAIAVIVNPDNPIDSLSADQVRAIFKGEITNWSQVGGQNRRIGLVNRDEASGTREAFFKILMHEELFDPAAAVLPGTGQVRSVVGEAVGAIGYISYGFVNDDVKLIAVDGVRPSEETIKDGSYPIQRTLHFFTQGEPTGPTADFIEYVISDKVQDGVVRDAGFTAIPRED